MLDVVYFNFAMVFTHNQATSTSQCNLYLQTSSVYTYNVSVYTVYNEAAYS